MLFSIVIPIYNVDRYLDACLASVLLQNATEWECVCVDDGSTDGCAAILKKYRARPQFKIIRQDNAGVSAARNCGLKAAAGDWIIFLDADDVLAPGTISCLRNVIAAVPNLDIVRFSALTFDETICWTNPTPSNYDVVDTSKVLCGSDVAAMLWGAAYRRSTLPDRGFQPYTRGEDRLFAVECLIRSNKIVRLHASLYGYRVRPGSSMLSPMTLRKLQDRIGYSFELMDALRTSGKTSPRSIFRELALNLTESYVKNIYEIDSADRDEAWRLWWMMLPKLAMLREVPTWSRLVAHICAVLQLRFVACVTCYAPILLKQHGFHR